MKTALFDYHLPPSLIAQQPAEPRHGSRLMVLHRATGTIEHRRMTDLTNYLRAGDLLIANDSRVIPARLHARKPTGGRAEIFLLRQLDEAGTSWSCLVRGRKLGPGARLHLTLAGTDIGITCDILTADDNATRTVHFSEPILNRLGEFGEMPLPPYITHYEGDPERYQTVFSHHDGSVAAPTAGLHFSPELLMELRQAGVRFDTVTLHIGLDTFRPVTAERIEDHAIHTEWATLDANVAQRINEMTLSGGRIVAVGTTTVRALEWAATGAQSIDPYGSDLCPWKRTAAYSADVDLFIRPGYRFRAVDMLLTNFHLPKSSLLMLVSAFVGQPITDDWDEGRRMLLAAYEEAIKS